MSVLEPLGREGSRLRGGVGHRWYVRLLDVDPGLGEELDGRTRKDAWAACAAPASSCHGSRTSSSGPPARRQRTLDRRA